MIEEKDARKRKADDDVGSPRRSPRLQDPRSAEKLSDGGPGSRAHDPEGVGHGRAAVRHGMIPPAATSPTQVAFNVIEHAARTKLEVRRMARTCRHQQSQR